MARSIPFVSAALSCSLWMSACVGSQPIPVPAPLPPSAAVEEAPQTLPLDFERGDIPEGWVFGGPTGLTVVFTNAQLQAKVQFSFYQVVVATPETYVKTVVARSSSDPTLSFGPVEVSADGTEASVRIIVTAAGAEPAKFGRIVVRSFPGRTSLGAALMGLWPQENDAETTPVFEVFKSWMRVN